MTADLEKKAYEYSIKVIPFIECISQNDKIVIGTEKEIKEND